MLNGFAEWVSNTPLTEMSRSFLGSASVVPPLTQTVHLTGIILLTACVIFPAITTISKRSPAPGYSLLQTYSLRGFFAGIFLMLVSGLPFLLARPYRYANNPVFTIKALMLAAAIPLAWVLLRQYQRQIAPSANQRWLALCTLLIWVMLILAGRWIAYSEYLFWPEDY